MLYFRQDLRAAGERLVLTRCMFWEGNKAYHPYHKPILQEHHHALQAAAAGVKWPSYSIERLLCSERSPFSSEEKQSYLAFDATCLAQ